MAGAPPQSIAPYVLRLVRSDDVFARLNALLGSVPVEWVHATARSVMRRGDGLYEVATDEGTLRARWVFDSACGVDPKFPSSSRPRALLSGTGIRVAADRPVFDPATATLFDPLDERQFAYGLPLSPTEALIESASFGASDQQADRTPLLRYLRTRYPEASFTVTHEEYGSIPLGFAPPRTIGPRHILLGTKRDLVKPSAGYGVVRIAKESEYLARLWRQRRPLPPSRQASRPWRWLDEGFLRLASRDPRRPLSLLQTVMGAIPLAQSLSFIDEQLPPRQLAPLLRSTYPIVFRKKVVVARRWGRA